jgi:hypothetical protein
MGTIEVCRSESDSFRTKIFISDWIGLIKLFRSRIGLDFKNEKFILLKDSSDRIGILYQKSVRIRIRQFWIGSDWILNISQLSDYKHPIRSDAHL